MSRITQIEPPEVIWEPKDSLIPIEDYSVSKYIKYVESKYGQSFGGSWHKLHQWSVDKLEDFWESIWDFGEIKHSRKYDQIFDATTPMSKIPGFFKGSKLNYAENLISNPAIHSGLDDHVAIIGLRELGTDEVKVTYAELRRMVARMAQSLREHGIKKLDRVAAITSHSVECIVLFLAVGSLGAIFSSISADMGLSGVLSRLRQVRPKLIFADNAVKYNGKILQQSTKLAKVLADLNSGLKPENCTHVVFIPNIPNVPITVPPSPYWTTLSKFATKDPNPPLVFEQVDFSHPWMIVFSSGTTGEAKCIIHSHGGCLLTARKEQISQSTFFKGQDIYLQYTTTAWIMHSALLSALTSGVTIVLYDGFPLKPIRLLTDIISKYKITVFGTSPRYLQELQANEFRPKDNYDLSHLRLILSTGSILNARTGKKFYEDWPKHICLASISGGTDIAATFLGGAPIVPAYAGYLSVVSLGLSVHAYDENHKIRDDDGGEGELVCDKPFPSMPVGFWGDPDGKKYFNSYFNFVPDAWTQGDLIIVDNKTRAVCILGRSDGVLNPSGVRFGSSDIYNAVDPFAEVSDSICVGQRRKVDNDERVLLFVKLNEGYTLTKDLSGRIAAAIRTKYSPRHVPAGIFAVSDVPYTINGKKMEAIVKKVVSDGFETVTIPTSIANPDCIKEFAPYFEVDKYLGNQAKL